MFASLRLLFTSIWASICVCIYLCVQPLHGLAAEVNSNPNQPLNIVVTIAPFYNLVAAVSDDINQLTLLVAPNVSIHGYSLKPSDITALSKADVIFWGGNVVEPFLAHPMQHIPKTKNISAFIDDPNILQLPVRNDPRWGKSACGCAHKHAHESGANSQIDPHIWLSINNAKHMVANIAKILAKIDPINANIYLANAKAFTVKLNTMQDLMLQKTSALKHKPYLVFHDAYQYLEYEYGLNAIGAITINPELPASANRIQEIKAQIKNSASLPSNSVQCIFSEPQFQPKIVKSLVESTPVKSGILDPLGQASDLGKDGYIKLLTAISDSLTACLS